MTVTSVSDTLLTFTQGQVSGLVNEDGVEYSRAWIKTDATISGGNSGGTAVDDALDILAADPDETEMEPIMLVSE